MVHLDSLWITHPFRNRSLGFFPEENVPEYILEGFSHTILGYALWWGWGGWAWAPVGESLVLPIFSLALAARNLLLGLILWPRSWPILDSWTSLSNWHLQNFLCARHSPRLHMDYNLSSSQVPSEVGTMSITPFYR